MQNDQLLKSSNENKSLRDPKNFVGREKQTIQLESSWLEELKNEFEKPYMVELRAFLLEEQKQGAVVFPKPKEYFQALNLTPLNQVKVVILGQDPYHGPGQAHGLCFSVKPGVDVPPSLQNIFKEMNSDLNIEQPKHGYLESWAKQGVLLLNATLTVRAGAAGSHQNRGWENFTDQCINVLNRTRKNLVFMLWGSYAHKKGQHIDSHKHHILKAPHPSPLSAYRGFLGCKHFSKANKYLEEQGLKSINWQLPEIKK